MNTGEIFTDPATVAAYADATPRRVPGFADLHRMAMLLLAEQAGESAEILVLGAGGGLELKAFAEARPGWRFIGVDPSAEMLDLARQVLGPLADRVTLRQGYAEDAPAGPYDGATCLLVLHFLPAEERLRTLRALHERLRPGARLVIAQHSVPGAGDLRRWLARSVAFAAEGAPGAGFEASAAQMMARLPLLPADEEEALLREAGFSDVALFYAAFSFRGWVATA